MSFSSREARVPPGFCRPMKSGSSLPRVSLNMSATMLVIVDSRLRTLAANFWSVSFDGVVIGAVSCPMTVEPTSSDLALASS